MAKKKSTDRKILNASEMGKLGGPARAASLTPEQRQEIAGKAGKAAQAKLTPEQRSEAARRASLARWAKKRLEEEQQ